MLSQILIDPVFPLSDSPRQERLFDPDQMWLLDMLDSEYHNPDDSRGIE
jgi:hypothetical protein